MLGAAAAAPIAFLVPIFGVLALVLVLGERMPPTLALGGTIVLAGLWLMQTPRSVGATAMA